MSTVKNIKIHIHSLIDNIDNSEFSSSVPEINENDYIALFRYTKNEFAFSYEESGDGGKVFCDILAKDNRITVSRRGAIKSVFLFEEGKSHASIYEITPYKFDMTIITKKLKYNLSEDGGIIDILYTMSVGGADKRCRMKITVGEKS